MTSWTEEDEGLLWAYKIREYLRQNGQLEHISATSPLPMQPGEQCMAITTGRLRNLKAEGKESEDKGYFKLTYNFAKDPLGWLVMKPALLPFNLISKSISNAGRTKIKYSWPVIGEGDLVITDRALLHAAPNGQLRFPWRDVWAVDLSYSPPGIRLQWGYGSGYFIEVLTVYRVGLVMMMRYLALGNRGDDLKIPHGLLDRARQLGKL